MKMIGQDSIFFRSKLRIGSMLRTAQRIFAWLQLQSWKYAGYCLEWKSINNTLIKGDSPIRMEIHPGRLSEIWPSFACTWKPHAIPTSLQDSCLYSVNMCTFFALKQLTEA